MSKVVYDGLLEEQKKLGRELTTFVDEVVNGNRQITQIASKKNAKGEWEPASIEAGDLQDGSRRSDVINGHIERGLAHLVD